MSNVAILRVFLFTVLIAVNGCESRPKAPVLDNNPLFVNEREGFQFMVPDGWFQQQKTDLPPGSLTDAERTLVLYRAFKPSPSSMEVSCRDVPEEVDLGEFLSKRKRSGSGWTQYGTPEPVEYGGKKGTRYFLKGKPGGKATSSETVVFRRKERVYFFGGFYPTGDTVRRAQIRQFLNSLRWTK